MMSRLLKLGIVLGLLWSLYWYGAGYSLRLGVAGWFQEREAQGWQADFASISTSGYPLRHITTLTSPALADPVNGTAWRADWLNLNNPAIWPGHQSLQFPETPQRLSYFDQTVVLRAQRMHADLHLTPGINLELERMALEAGQWQTDGPAGLIAGSESLVLSMVQTEDPATYRFEVQAPGFVPGDVVRRAAGPEAALPERFQTLELDLKVRFDRPWDRRALEERRPQPVAIDLKLARAEWGALSLFVAGAVTVDGNGVPTGKIAFKAENWRDMLAMLRESGAFPGIALESVERVLNLLAGVSGTRDTLDVELGLRDGMVTLGPFPLGPAPYIYLR